jgi:hypothetical protein
VKKLAAVDNTRQPDQAGDRVRDEVVMMQFLQLHHPLILIPGSYQPEIILVELTKIKIV